MEEVKAMTAHQALLLEMLKDFDAVCRRHHISYQLFAGTALGAVRHHGFIPWDDDVDVILMRSEYDRLFAEAAGDFDPERYYVQQEHGPHWPMQFSKLRRNHTACIEKYHPKDMAIHQGVYLDIFPCDRLSEKGAVCTGLRDGQHGKEAVYAALPPAAAASAGNAMHAKTG